MTEPSELASLIADTLAVLESLRRQGVDVLPVGALAGLPQAELEDRAPVRPAPVRTPAPLRPAPGELRDEDRAPLPTPSAPPLRPAVTAPQLREERAAPQPLPPTRSVVPSPVPPVVPASDGGAGLFGSKWSKVAESPDVALAALRQEIGGCAACGRCATRAQVVLGEGPPRPMLLVVTDPPDVDADATGRVLSGDASLMLERMLLNVVRVDRREVQIVPIVRCAGPGPLTATELAACRPFLERQILLARPRAVLVLGEAARAALDLQRHGAWGEIHGVAALSTFHPTWLLTNPGDKKATLGHLQEIARRVG